MKRFKVNDYKYLVALAGATTPVIVEYVGDVTEEVVHALSQLLYNSNVGVYVNNTPVTWDMWREYKRVLNAPKVTKAIDYIEDECADEAFWIIFADATLRKRYRKGGVPAVVDYCHGYCHGYDVGTTSPVARERRTIVVFDEREEPFIRTSPKYWEQYTETLMDTLRAYQSVKYYKKVGIKPDWEESPEFEVTDWEVENFKTARF